MNAQHTLDGSFHICVKDCPDMVVGIASGKFCLTWRKPDDRSQQWALGYNSDYPNCYWFINRETNTGLSAAAYGAGLMLSGAGDPWFVGGELNNGFNVMRLWNNDGWNLNAMGGGLTDVGKLVGVWNWSGGGGNELWKIARTTNWPYPPPHNYVQIYCRSAITVQDGDLSGARPLLGGTGTVPASSDRSVFDKIESPGFGFALRNKYNNRYLRWNGPKQLLGQAFSMSLHCLWTAAKVSAGWYAVPTLPGFQPKPRRLRRSQEPDRRPHLHVVLGQRLQSAVVAGSGLSVNFQFQFFPSYERP